MLTLTTKPEKLLAWAEPPLSTGSTSLVDHGWGQEDEKVSRLFERWERF